MKINAMLGKRMSLEEIAEKLNATKFQRSRHEQMDSCICSEGIRLLKSALEGTISSANRGCPDGGIPLARKCAREALPPGRHPASVPRDRSDPPLGSRAA